MIALLIVPLLISGFILLTKHPFHFYRLHRYTGQLLYMKAAGYGFFCVMCAAFLAVILKALFTDFHPVMDFAKWTSFTKEDHLNRMWSWFICISLTSIAIGYLWAYTAKAIYVVKFIKALVSDVNRKQAIVPKDIPKQLKLSVLAPLMLESPMNALFFHSMLYKKSILVTLDCGKVYVGVVSRIAEPNETDAPTQEISLTPVMSGYRHKDTKRIYFINDYANLAHVDTNINIPRSNITHSSWFNEDVHKQVDDSFVGPRQPSDS